MIQLGKEYTRHSFLSSQEPQRFRMKAFSGGNCKTVTNVKAHKKNKAHQQQNHQNTIVLKTYGQTYNLIGWHMDIEVINNSNNYFPNTCLVMMTLIAKFGIQK